MPIGEAAALAGLGWVASPVLKDLVNKSISYLGNDIAEGLEDLETTVLPQIQLTIEAAQHSNPNLKAQLAKWLARLKNAYFDAEAILHELEYERLKRKANGEGNKLLVHISSKPIIKPLAKFTDRVVKKASLLSPQKRKLLQQLKKLKEIAAEAKTFRDLLGLQETGSKYGVIAGNSRSITSSLLAHKVFGRDEERDEIINFLLDDGDHDGDCYSVVAITGMGGAGKTTLAQYIYNDPRVKEHFLSRMWLSLSQNLDIIERTKEMIDCVSKEKCLDTQNLSVLQNNLLETLPESDNILVVLDDVWYDREAGENQWDNLLKPFAFRGAKCKIVVTSRSSSPFPNALQPGKLTELSDLALGDFISLLRYHAIDGLQTNNPQLKNDLIDIVDQIAKKISKLPLAAKVVGNQLHQRPNISFWQATLENVNLSDTMEILLWSFHRFDVQLQRCFLFSGVYPKGIRFDGSVLYSWVALDFIQPTDDNRSVEDIGLEYFHIMVASSIFHPVHDTSKWYVMHDLFHDLAEKLSAEDCFRVTNTQREIPSTVQHIFLNVNYEHLKGNLSSMCNLSNLRTIILGNTCIDDVSEVISQISTNCRNLRVLEIWFMGNKMLPRVVGDLRNLRMLQFFRSSLEELPNSILQLYHLQFLQLPSSVKTLPNKLSNLINLKCIQMINNDDHLVNTLPPVPYLGKLTSLQCLNEFHVRKEEGYKLQQLGRLKEIGGSLRIANLENVRDKDEAIEARLIDKPKLKRLDLVWVESNEINGSEIEVIEALRPPTYLELLTIDGYRGSTYPTWLQEDSFIKNIKDINFYNCNALTILPSNLHQFRHCSTFVIENLGALRELTTFPENLTRLSIVKCPCLVVVCENELQVNENQSILESQFLKFDKFDVGPCTDTLDHELKSFQKTCSVENCAEQLQIMESATRDNAAQLSVNQNVNIAWWYCHQQRMNFIFKCSTRANKLKLPFMLRNFSLSYCCVSDGALSDCLRGMFTLEELYLEGIMTITTLPSAEVLENLLCLRILEIKQCWYLRSLGGMHALSCLEHFLVHGCWCLEMESGYTLLPSTLQSFIIRICTVPQYIFNNDLPCLQNVEINSCIVPRSLSFRRLTLLKSLVLLGCPDLFSIGGLESRPFINSLQLLKLPNVTVESVLESWQGCQRLFISSSVMLNKLLSSQDFVPPPTLAITYCQEETISFEKSDGLQCIKQLVFLRSKTKSLPKTLSDFSTIKGICFKDCPEILELPELPGSVECIQIRGCPMLSERCKPNGLDWHKIRCIQYVDIE